jgi:hypothetical protein
MPGQAGQDRNDKEPRCTDHGPGLDFFPSTFSGKWNGVIHVIDKVLLPKS